LGYFPSSFFKRLFTGPLCSDKDYRGVRVNDILVDMIRRPRRLIVCSEKQTRCELSSWISRTLRVSKGPSFQDIPGYLLFVATSFSSFHLNINSIKLFSFKISLVYFNINTEDRHHSPPLQIRSEEWHHIRP
jgi:hypothetical protein